MVQIYVYGSHCVLPNCILKGLANLHWEHHYTSDLFFSNPFQYCLIANKVWPLWPPFHVQCQGLRNSVSVANNSKAVNMLDYKRLQEGPLPLTPSPLFWPVPKILPLGTHPFGLSRRRFLKCPLESVAFIWPSVIYILLWKWGTRLFWGEGKEARILKFCGWGVDGGYWGEIESQEERRWKSVPFPI